MEPMELCDAVFTPAQLAAIQDTVSSTVQAVFQSLPHTTTLSRLLPRFPAHQVLVFLLWSLRTASIVPWTRHSRIKYSAVSTLISLCFCQKHCTRPRPRPPIALRGLAPGSLGSPLTVVKRKKPVVDSFQKWLDAFMAYMLVIVTAYPNRAVELIKYQQIISRAVTKFKGLAWYTYDEHFRRRAARDLTIAWDRIDIELWTVTFTARTINLMTAPTRNPAKSLAGLPSFASITTNPQGVSDVPVTSPTIAAAVDPAVTHSSIAPAPDSMPQAPNQQPRAIAAKNKVEQCQRKQRPTVSTPLDVDKLAFELVNHPNRSFVDNLVNALRYGTRIGYLGPQKFRVSNNLISASQHPEVISANLSKEMSLGRVAGPFLSPPLPNFQCHPIGVVPKKHSTEWRTIYHLSYPPGDSVNDHIPKDPYSLQYVRVDDAISILKS
ncbi:unnamed protein product [Porites lobata]|uniref:Uncharacterized protein n=1 Tax=Porites lobata TaxID=104759 RepID=A0ABN8RPQ0_9CNID|nr:unnamed protein product [Porites lobata]